MLQIKKMITSALLGLCFTSTVFAGTEDWDGHYTFKGNDNNYYTISHSPTGVRFMFFNIGGCLSLHEGAKINGFEIPADVEFCRIDNAEKFTNEVQKLGIITEKKITLGPTYPN